ncbi:MAG: hypothetical protein QME52_00755 [Bacteroidota bacterium]|nr:hypothetical protein [Bacteroidota bacterium]
MKRWHWISLGILTIISIIVELTMVSETEHGTHWWSVIPLFYILFGFVGCVVIVFFSKAIGKIFLQKKEDYYDTL